MVLPLLLKIATTAAPAILNLLDSDDKVVSRKSKESIEALAQFVTGEEDLSEAAKILDKDPTKYVEYQQALTARTTALYQAETERLKAINETIRAEVASSDPYVRRMRPTFGYCVAFTWTGLFLAIIYSIVFTTQAAAVITAVSSLSTMFSVALAVLGVYVYKRSEDKKPPSKELGVLGAVARRIAGGGQTQD